MSSDVWNSGDANWTTAADWSAGVPTSTSTVTVAAGAPQITAAVAIASLVVDPNGAAVDFVSAGASTLSGAVTNGGSFNVDAATGAHGSSVTIAGALTNSGVVQLGESNNSLSAADTVKVAAISNAYGDINVDGGTAAAGNMLLDVTGGTAGFGVAGAITGDISLSGHAVIEFASGEFSSIGSGSTLAIEGANAFIADASGLTSNSALTGLSLIAGTFELSNGAAVATAGPLVNINYVTLSTASGTPATNLAIGGAYTNDGYTLVDTGSAGGSTLSVNGVLTNDGTLNLGSSSLTASSTVSVKGLVNDGSILLSAAIPTAALALLKDSAVAGFGAAGQLWGAVSLVGDSEIQFASGEISTIISGAELYLSGPTARIADAATPSANSALTSLGDVLGTLIVNSGVNLALAGSLSIARLGTVKVDDSNQLGGDGGSTLTIAGTLANAGDFLVGEADLTGSTSVSVNAVQNGATGEIVVSGSFYAPERALLNVKSGVAGFGAAGEILGSVAVSGDAAIEFASGEISTIAAGASLSLWGPQASLSDPSSTTTNSALTGLTHVAGNFTIDDDVVVSVSGSLGSLAFILVDTQNSGGSSLTVAGTLTNNDELEIGSAGIVGITTVKAAAINGTGEIELTGGTSAADLALLDITGAAGFGEAGVLANFITMSSAARIEFASGEITTITQSGGIQLFGSQAVIADASAPTTNSALQGLASNQRGFVELYDGASITTTGAFANSGGLDLDSSVFPPSTGGSSITIQGTLTNTSAGSISVGTGGNVASDTVTAGGFVNQGSVSLAGASSTAQAVLNITSGAAGFGAAGVLYGQVSLAGYSSIRFVSGEIARVGMGATLELEGADSFIEDGATNTESALTGLNDVVGTLTLSGGAGVSATGSLTIGSPGTVNVGGGSKLQVGAALTNDGALTVGGYDLTQAAEAIAASLVNNANITVEGGAASSATALLDVGGGAGFGTTADLIGTVSLSGYAAISFASGQITTILSNGTFTLAGAHAVIEDGTSGSNSALEGLATIAGGLDLSDGVKIATTGGVSVTGNVNIDSNTSDVGGTDWTVGGALALNTNYFTVGNSEMTSSDTVTASSLSNAEYLTLTGGATAAGETLLDITGAAGFGAADVLSGTVQLSGSSAIEFKSGQITSLASSASLFLDGPDAFIEDGVTNSNSALTSLATNGGQLDLETGAKLSTGALTNNDLLSVDGSYAGGGSSFTVSGLLTNNYGIDIGNISLASNTSLTASSFTNNNYIDLDGDNGANGQLLVFGAVTNNGEFNVTSDIENLAGAISGTGTFDLSSGSALELGSSVTSGQTISFSGTSSPDTLELADATAFKGTLSGFGAGDVIDLTTFGASTTHSFAADVLTFTSGSNTATLDFSGSYTSGDFAIASSASGTTIKFV